MCDTCNGKQIGSVSYVMLRANCQTKADKLSDKGWQLSCFTGLYVSRSIVSTCTWKLYMYYICWFLIELGLCQLSKCISFRRYTERYIDIHHLFDVVRKYTYGCKFDGSLPLSFFTLWLLDKSLCIVLLVPFSNNFVNIVPLASVCVTDDIWK